MNPENSISNKRFDEIKPKTTFQEFILYLDSIRNQAPFNFNSIAIELNLELEDVTEYFTQLSESFRLFHHFQKDKMLAQDDIFTSSALACKTIEISIGDFQEYATFAYLALKIPFFPKKKILKSLHYKFKILFEEETNGWLPSKIGIWFVDEWKKFARLNQKINELSYFQYRLLLTEK